MNIHITRPDRNVGLADRMIRGCLALCMISMSVYGFVWGQQITLIALGFGLLGTYAAWSALTGRCFAYRSLELDTRSDEEAVRDDWQRYEEARKAYRRALAASLGNAVAEPAAAVAAPAEPATTTDQPEPEGQPAGWGQSLLGR